MQDVKEISESMKNAIQHVKEEFQGSPESFHGLEPARPEGLLALDRSPFDDDEFQNGLEVRAWHQCTSAAAQACGRGSEAQPCAGHRRAGRPTGICSR